MDQTDQQIAKPVSPSLFALLKPYRGFIFGLVILALLSNGITLYVPQIISHGIDNFLRGGSPVKSILTKFSIAAVLIFIFTYLQSIVQTFASERVARDLRRDLSAKISGNSYAYVEQVTPAKLLTN